MTLTKSTLIFVFSLIPFNLAVISVEAKGRCGRSDLYKFWTAIEAIKVNCKGQKKGKRQRLGDVGEKAAAESEIAKKNAERSAKANRGITHLAGAEQRLITAKKERVKYHEAKVKGCEDALKEKKTYERKCRHKLRGKFSTIDKQGKKSLDSYKKELASSEGDLNRSGDSLDDVLEGDKGFPMAEREEAEGNEKNIPLPEKKPVPLPEKKPAGFDKLHADNSTDFGKSRNFSKRNPPGPDAKADHRTTGSSYGYGESTQGGTTDERGRKLNFNDRYVAMTPIYNEKTGKFQNADGMWYRPAGSPEGTPYRYVRRKDTGPFNGGPHSWKGERRFDGSKGFARSEGYGRGLKKYDIIYDWGKKTPPPNTNRMMTFCEAVPRHRHCRGRRAFGTLAILGDMESEEVQQPKEVLFASNAEGALETELDAEEKLITSDLCGAKDKVNYLAASESAVLQEKADGFSEEIDQMLAEKGYPAGSLGVEMFCQSLARVN